MKNKLLFLSVCLCFFASKNQAQQTIAIENFDGSPPFWPNDIASQVFTDPSSSNEGLFIQNASTDNPNFSNNSAYGQDLKGETLEPSLHPYIFTFQNINVSNYSTITLSFDYAVFANVDKGSYEVILNNVGQGSVEFYNDPDTAIDYGTITVNIPNGTSTVGLVLEGTLNGASDTIELDNFIITGFPTSGNQPPSITSITQAPSSDVEPTDTVSVSADVTDDAGVVSVTLNWGTSSGILTNNINMSLGSGDTYTSDADIPAQADGTTIYYEIEATDNNGTPLTAISSEQSYLVAIPIPVPNIIISEIMQNPSAVSDANGEYIELYNATNNPLDIQNWVITEDSNTHQIGKSLIIPENDFIILGKNDDFNTNGGITVDYKYPSSFSLNNTNNVIILSDDASNEVDRVEYDGGPIWPDPTGAAMVYIGLEDENNNDGNLWREATATEGLDSDLGSPGLNGINQYLSDVLVYDNAWSPSEPDGTTGATNVVIKNGTATTLASDLNVQSLTIKSGANLEVTGRLTINNDLLNFGNITLKSTSISNTATLGALSINANIEAGQATVERYIPGKRAFRFLSSPVTTSGSINANWQEGQNNTSTTNINNNPGFGTHITGSTTGANGFDATASGNPSLFDFDNTNQTWEAVANTDVLTLERGKPYRLFVRGSRAIDLSNNTATADDTRLRMTGTMAGAQQINVTNLSSTTGDYNLIGNPYQSAIDMNLVLSTYTTNLNTTYYYIWDPKVNTRGAYVVVDVTTGSNTVQGGVGSSSANEFLQPNQAFFVRTTGASPSLEFHQLQKVSGNLTATHKPMMVEEMNIKLFSTLNSNSFLVDGAKIYFDTNFSNQVDNSDAEKLGNQDENLALVNESKFLSIERRTLPLEDEEIPLFNNNYRNTDYHFSIDLPSLNNEAYLVDNYLQAQTLLQEGVTTYNFTVDENIVQSMASDRFKLLFGKPLGAVNSQMASLNVYPNPVHGDILHITDANINGDTNVKMVNILGQQVYQKAYKNADQELTLNNLSVIPAGVYLLKVTSNGKEFTQKIIKQ